MSQERSEQTEQELLASLDNAILELQRLTAEVAVEIANVHSYRASALSKPRGVG